MDALKEGRADEFYRRGQEICGELEWGTDRASIIGNLGNFWGRIWQRHSPVLPSR